HASTLKSPSYTKSVSWQHYLNFSSKDLTNSYMNGMGKKEYSSYLGTPNNTGNDSNLLIVFYVQIMPDDFV
ncbi:hypothetical protein, partial [Shigella dysenteriae]|uniref:hypothetical protein n=1 Tax=Shigella dysenteriae TaxID=622 RepID=UPI0034A4C1DA